MRPPTRQRTYALLIAFGISILLFRTVRMMLLERAFEILVAWASALLVAEFLLDLACLLSSIRWLVSGNRSHAGLPLRLIAAAIILHALRVGVYVLGRTGPWENFDVKPEYWPSYEFDWFWVYFAAVMASLGVIGLLVVWQIIRSKKRQSMGSEEE